MPRKITHNDFISLLYSNNEHYRNGDFDVLGTYSKMKSKIHLKDKYSEHSKTPERLLSGESLSSKTSLNKLQYYRNYISINCKDFDLNNYNIISVTDSDKDNSALIDTKHGLCKMLISNILKGAVPSIKCAIDKTEYFISVLKDRGDIGITDYSTIKYMSAQVKVKYMTKFGYCEMSPNSLMYCERADNMQSIVDKTKYIKDLIYSEKGDLYDLSNVRYVNNNTPIKIKCKEHGVFDVAPGNFVGCKSHRGCPKCGRESTTKSVIENPVGWSYKSWSKAGARSKYFDNYKVYILECSNNSEHFYKIGRTFLKTDMRFKSNKLPYSYKILHEVISENPEYICKLESELKASNKVNKYIPLVRFEGMYECFSNIDDTLNLIKDLIK